MDRGPLYIQTPKCLSKAGIVGSGRKMYTDLVFTNENEEIIQWMEAMETTVRRKIYENRGKWFASEMSEDDIEGCFSPMVKLFRSGKQYCVRVNINSKPDAKPLKIYDEDEMAVEATQITDKTSMIAILEIQGVRCTSKSFCVDVEMKQLMVMKPSDLFDSCIILKGRAPPPVEKHLAKTADPVLEETSENPVVPEDNPLFTPLVPDVLMEETSVLDDRDVIDSTEPIIIADEVVNDANQVLDQDVNQVLDHEPNYLGLSESDDILEVNLDVNEIDAADTFQLKDKKEVYYEMYREALQKAKAAKAVALTEFMEARRIKNLYMLKDLNDSDDESDLEDLDDLDDDDE